jgi:DNA topoisomerase-1
MANGRTTRTQSRARIAAVAKGSARAAGLRYTTDRHPGITRVRAGKGFRYRSPAGHAISDARTLQRIKALAVPPAWTSVWIAADPNAHVQATGRDARGRKQYRYHARWREMRHQTKYERMIPFARALPQIRRRVESHLREPALSKTKVVAAVVQLLEKTLIRIGNLEYARANRSFGLTTLKDGHVQVRGVRVRFAFRGKSGVKQSVTLSDAKLARLVKRCQELPGQELFQYVDDAGRSRPITSADVNAYLRDVAGAEFTAKDFRTWAGTLLATIALRDAGSIDRPLSKRKTTSVIVRAVERVAVHLGNTPAVCRACYIHPAVLEAAADGSLLPKLNGRHRARRGLSADECAVLALIEGPRDWREQLVKAAA